MTSFINTNLGSINAQRHLTTSQAGLATSLERLSSGLRINNARDDAAGMSIAERFTSQIKGVNQAGRNANDGISMTQVAEGSLATTSDSLQRIRELTVQAANATNTAGDRKTIQDEVNQLLTEMDRTAQTTQFNGQNLMDGSASNMAFQVGANANQTVSVTNGNFRTNGYGSYRMGAVVEGSLTDLTKGDLVKGSTAQTVASGAVVGTVSRATTSVDVTINGSTGQSTTISTGSNSTAKSVAKLINDQSQKTNVTATARTEVNLTFGAGGTFTFDVTSNNNQTNQSAQTIAMSIGTTGTQDDYAGAVTAFNNVSSATGVTAKINDAFDGITLTNETGEDIKLVPPTNVAQANTNAAAFGKVGSEVTIAVSGGSAAGAIATGQLTLDSNKSFGLTTTDAGTTYFLAAAVSSASSMQAVNMINVTSVAGATRSLALIDGALANIDAQRGLYGAMQSRFANAVSNLQSASENMSASRSRIQDTDFASETANLTRGQILQQAGTAMLAQANSMPNGVLALLRG